MSYRPDEHTDDDGIADELVEWVAHAATRHAARTTEVSAVAVTDAGDLELTLRTGAVVTLTAKANTKPKPKAKKEAKK